MKLLSKAPDGGASSGVTGYTLIECKSLFSIVLLHFNTGTREAYHSHAFNAITLWLRGRVVEERLGGECVPYRAGQFKYTSRLRCHRVSAGCSVWALSLRGPWRAHWYEIRRGSHVKLTHGRVIV